MKLNKDDFVDAEAIAEAFERRNLWFVSIQTYDQLDQGMMFAQKPAKLTAAIAGVLENAETRWRG